MSLTFGASLVWSAAMECDERLRVAWNPQTPDSVWLNTCRAPSLLLDLLAEDHNSDVRLRAAQNPNYSPALADYALMCVAVGRLSPRGALHAAGVAARRSPLPRRRPDRPRR